MENRRLSLLYNTQSLYNSSDVGTVEYQLSGYLIDNYDKIHELNIYEVAEDNNVSRATVRRFCQNLGYSNFKELKDHFKEFDEGISQYDEFYSRANFLSDLKQQIFNMFDELEYRLSTKELTQIVCSIRDADQVILIASSTIANSIRFFQQTMAIFGKRVSIVVDEEKFNSMKHTLTKQSIIMIFSISGLFAQVMMKCTYESNAQVFLFTNSRNPLFNKYFDKVYHLTSMGNQRPSEIIYYTYGISFILDSILNEYYELKSRK